MTSLALAATLAAQDEGGGGGGGGGGFGAGESGGGGVRPPTRFEQFASRLRLDRNQTTEASAILQTAAEEARPIGLQMLQLQNRLVNALLANASEAEIAAIRDEYTEAAAAMTGLETRTFATIYAKLRPNQQNGAPQAFDLMAGWLQPSPTAAGRGGGGARGRTGGGQ
jgi:hypothetical protein